MNGSGFPAAVGVMNAETVDDEFLASRDSSK